MLIAFHSSPFSAPLQTGTPNRGFELNVDVLFTDSDSYDFIQGAKCEFHINASIPGEFNNTLLFTFISLLKFSHTRDIENGVLAFTAIYLLALCTPVMYAVIMEAFSSRLC